MFPLYLAFLSPGEWAVVLLIVVLLFGAAKIPELARSLGSAKREFERGSREHPDAAKEPTGDDAKVLEAARAMGIPTEGRSVADVKKDVQTKLS